MSIESESGHSGHRPSGRGSSVLTGVLVATVLIVAALVSPVSAHDTGTTSHLWDHFKALRVAGTINADTNPVHWTKLKGVPASLADGVDNGFTVAGFGLNDTWGIAVAVDPTEVQKRVTTTCPAGQAMKSIRQDGTAVCTPVSQALSKTIADTGIICNDWCTEGSLALTAGTWVITAKIVVNQDPQTDEEILFTVCQLRAGGRVDESQVEVTGDYFVNATLPMQLMTTVASGASAYVYCKDLDVGDVSGTDLSIIATRVGG